MFDAKRPFYICCVVCALLCAAGPARAACGSGTPAYDDISAIMFERHGCGMPMPNHSKKELSCSVYWVFFSNDAQKATYSQYSLAERGTFGIDASLDQAVAILRKHEFYLLNPREYNFTDTRETVLTVRHCGVITRLLMYPRVGLDDAVFSLFRDIDTLVENSKKTKLSESPEDFKYGQVFEGH